ncbi:MAG: sensor domain-containing diguanylate cyclase, partial [Coriobacteriia bacterium]
MQDRSLLITEFFEQRYLAGRVIATVLLVGMVLWGIFSPNIPADRSLAMIGVGLFLAITGVVLGVRCFLDVSTKQIMMGVFAFDLLAIAILGVAYHPYEDPSYPMFMVLPIIYVLVISRPRMWLTGVLSSLAYLAIHVVAGDSVEPMGAVIVLVKALVIVVMSVVIADASARFNRRETEIRQRSEAEETLNQELKRRLAELHAVSEITELIHSSLDFDNVGPLVLDILTKVINVPSCCLFVVDKSRAETLFTASVGMSGAAMPSRITSLTTSGLQVADDHFSCTSVVNHKQLMVVFCAPNDVIEGMSPEDMLVLQAVSNELVVAVENSQLYKLTKRLAITDELTGLFNYRYLQQKLDEEIERARRYHKDLSFIMIDVDDFKLFNDTNGHIAGDTALSDLASVIREVVREVDVVCRYGGEEFSVILPETDAAGAFVVAEKLREAVDKHDFQDADGKAGGHLTVSVGLASFPGHADNK